MRVSQTPEYYAWRDLIRRCTDPTNKWFHRYGGPDALPAAEELAAVMFNYDDTALVFARFNLLPDLVADALAHEASSPLHPNNRPAGHYGPNAPAGIAT